MFSVCVVIDEIRNSGFIYVIFVYKTTPYDVSDRLSRVITDIQKKVIITK